VVKTELLPVARFRQFLRPAPNSTSPHDRCRPPGLQPQWCTRP